jgi:parallel beta-helix repeat protein
MWSGRRAAPNARGTDGPFATLARARDAVREQKQNGGLKEPIVVMARGGKYYLREPFVLGEQDSGTPEYPVTYTAYPGEKPILSGGQKVTGWKSYRDSIFQAALPGAKGGRWKFRQLYFNGEPLLRSCWPKRDRENPLHGWACIEGPAWEGSKDAFIYKPGEVRHRWAKPAEVEVHLFVGHNWINDIIPVKSIDEARRMITLARSIYQIDRSPWFITVPFHPHQRFRVENALEDLEQPGEWCLDSEEGALYLWPPREDIDSAEIVAPILDCLIDLRGASWVTISGFTLTETMDGDDYHHEGYEGYGPAFPRRGLRYGSDAVHLKDSAYCRIENNRFYAVGGTAIYLEGYNARNSIRHNEIDRAGAYGVAMVGAKDYHPMYNRVEDNHIHHCGSLNKYANAVFLGLSNMNVVAHNVIHHLPHVAIGLGNSGYGRNIVEYNDIRFVDLEISDSGAINAWMEDPYPAMRSGEERAGHIIRCNLIADVPGVQVEADGRLRSPAHGRQDLTMGIYLDNGSSNCFVYGNILVRAGRFGIYLQGGRNNVVENNIIVDCACAVGFSDLVAHWFAPWMRGYMAGNRFCRNIFCTARPDGYILHLIRWDDRLVAQCDENVYYQKGVADYMVLTDGGKEIPLEDWRRMSFDFRSVLADPLFVAPERDDYRLQPESPALRLGFRPIDIERIGPRKRMRE